MNIKADVKDRILKPIAEVFDAIVNPDKISGYFISSASGPLKLGETITWKFSDVGGLVTVNVKELKPEELIVFEWSASSETALVTIRLDKFNEEATTIRITEDGWPMNEQGIKKALGQTQGWTDFICSMKAWLYCGINLRLGRSKGSY
jgi:uncharacterized protein YndB with AHSA1/START domain